jgi:type VI secretion system protein ImpH
MGTAVGNETDSLGFLAALAEAPYRFDFYQTLRRLECLHGDAPRWGSAKTPAQEPIRLGQAPDVSFAPAPLSAFYAGGEGRPRLHVLLFGLMGPNGPLPIHLTEYVRDRTRNQGDPTLSRFLDLLHHRFLSLFYRAWAQAQPHVNHDRPDDDRFLAYVGSFIGLAGDQISRGDSLPPLAKPFHAGALARHTRDADGLRDIITSFFGVKTLVQEFVGHWMMLDDQERTRIGPAAALGRTTVVGSRVWDRQHKFRLVVGPLSLAEYESFLPGGRFVRLLADFVRFYVNVEFDWDVRLVLKREEVPPLRLGATRLGWTSWLGHRTAEDDADDLCLNPQASLSRAAQTRSAVSGELVAS